MSHKDGQNTFSDRCVQFALLLSIAWFWWQIAWLSDDSGITLRVVLNFINGLGPNFNVDERVQVFTHPLWFLLVSAVIALTGEIYYSLHGLSLLCLLLGVYCLVRWVVESRSQALALVAFLICSRSFMDYSGSGLENPLTHLLLALFLAALYRRPLSSTSSPAILLLLAALMFLNRMDTVVLVAPVLIAAVLRDRRRGLWFKSALLCSAPVAAWLLFAIVYYGSWVPNTAYAKLSAGLIPLEQWSQGLLYFRDSLVRDYWSLPLTGCALIVSAVVGEWRERSLAVGVVAYLLYIISIGGDFMSGRFFSAPVLVCAALLVHCINSGRALCCLIVLAVAAALSSEQSHIRYLGSAYKGTAINASGIADERGFYYSNTGLRSGAAPTIANGLARMDWEYQVLKGVKRSYTLGLTGLRLGPQQHLYDPLGLADPLLARMPQGYGDNWRPGHYQRRIPRGYPESLLARANLIENRELAAAYEDIRLATRGDLWSSARWGAILRLNSGFYDFGALYAGLTQDQLLPEEPFYRRH